MLERLGNSSRGSPQPQLIAMKATIFTRWICDHLLPHAEKVKVAHPLMLRVRAESWQAQRALGWEAVFRRANVPVNHNQNSRSGNLIVADQEADPSQQLLIAPVGAKRIEPLVDIDVVERDILIFRFLQPCNRPIILAESDMD